MPGRMAFPESLDFHFLVDFFESVIQGVFEELFRDGDFEADLGAAEFVDDHMLLSSGGKFARLTIISNRSAKSNLFDA